MTNYRNGAELERACKRLFEANGYYVVRAAGSKGAADLVCLKRGEVVLVQCKLDGYLRPAERKAFQALAVQLHCDIVIAYWHKEGRAARTVKMREAVHQVNWCPDWAMDWKEES